MPKKLTITLRDSLYKELDKEAKKKFLTVNDIIASMVSRHVTRIRSLKKTKKRKVTAEKLYTRKRQIFK